MSRIKVENIRHPDGTGDNISLTDTGLVGVGTASPSTALDVAGAISLGAVALPAAGTARIFSRNTDSNLYIQTGSGNTLNLLDGSQNTMASFGSSVVILQTGNTERARIDASGRLLVGTTSNCGGPNSIYGRVQIVGNDSASAGAGILVLGRSEASTSITAGEACGAIVFSDFQNGEYAYIVGEADGTAGGANGYPGRIVFSTEAQGSDSGPKERMRITNNGQLRTLATQTAFLVSSATSAGTSEYLIGGQYSASSPGLGTNSFRVYTNGNVQNTNNSYTGISDIKLKENIVDASSQWDDLKAIQVRNYNFKEETGHETHTQLGVIAQEIELVSPGLISESPDRDEEGNDLGTVTKSVNYSVLYMKAVKALQEAMERIETLEQRLNDAGIA